MSQTPFPHVPVFLDIFINLMSYDKRSIKAGVNALWNKGKQKQTLIIEIFFFRKQTRLLETKTLKNTLILVGGTFFKFYF